MRDLAASMGLTELVSWCENLASGEIDGFSLASLNPSIATFVSDRNGLEVSHCHVIHFTILSSKTY